MVPSRGGRELGERDEGACVAHAVAGRARFVPLDAGEGAGAREAARAFVFGGGGVADCAEGGEEGVGGGGGRRCG